MSKVKLEAAKELIKEKRYQEARSILEGVDHPTARLWLSRLDTLMQPSTIGNQSNKRRFSRTQMALFALILILAAAIITTLYVVRTSGPQQQLVDIAFTRAAGARETVMYEIELTKQAE